MILECDRDGTLSRVFRGGSEARWREEKFEGVGVEGGETGEVGRGGAAT
jgi:hypothetical protein